MEKASCNVQTAKFELYFFLQKPRGHKKFKKICPEMEAVRAIRALQAAGCRIQGPEDASLDTLRVVKTRGRGAARILIEPGEDHAEKA